MAVAWAALRIQAEDPDAVMCVLPADHHIPDQRAFAAVIRKAARAARDAQVLVTIGVQPTRPDVGYGYIQVGAAAGRGFAGLRRVRRFIEKPDAAHARSYLRDGGYLWNAGIFIWSTQTLLEEIETRVVVVRHRTGPVDRVACLRLTQDGFVSSSKTHATSSKTRLRDVQAPHESAA